MDTRHREHLSNPRWTWPGTSQPLNPGKREQKQQLTAFNTQIPIKNIASQFCLEYIVSVLHPVTQLPAGFIQSLSNLILTSGQLHMSSSDERLPLVFSILPAAFDKAKASQ